MKSQSSKGRNNDWVQQSLQELKNFKLALDETAIVAITDTEGVITYVNQTFCDISRYSRDELIGQTHRIVNSGLHSKAFFTDMWETVAAGHIWRGTLRNKAKDGTFYWVDTTIVPFLDDTGKPYQYIAIRKDITYLKRVENELRVLNEGLEARIRDRTAELEALNKELSETLERLQESDRIRETFVAALTHDLRTPLIAEQRVIELLKSHQQSLPKAFQNIAERLAKNNAELLELVNKLLEIYQYEAGEVSLYMEQVNLYTLVTDCLDSLSLVAEQKSVVLENRVSVDIGIIEADPFQLKRVFYNLIHNAIQSIGKGNRVTISASKDKQSVQISVNDNGPGIAPEVLPHLFDRYFASQQSRKKIGSGLGLSICKMIIKLHKGTIDVETMVDQGTTFHVTLPKMQEVAP